MQDKYGSWAELVQHELDGVDFRVRSLERPDSPVVVLAPHGGHIEVGTSELAGLIAGEEHSLFCFEGLKPWARNRDLHVTSHRFDHPHCLALLARSQIALSIHGCRGHERIYVGGRDEALAARLTRHLGQAGFHWQADGHRYPGREPLNVCNRTQRRCGAQLELTCDLRGEPTRVTLATAIRYALAEHVAELVLQPECDSALAAE